MENINAVIERCLGQRPDVILGGHHGYYLHDDVKALVDEIVRLRSEAAIHVDAEIARRAEASKKASDDAWATWGSE